MVTQRQMHTASDTTIGPDEHSIRDVPHITLDTLASTSYLDRLLELLRQHFPSDTESIHSNETWARHAACTAYWSFSSIWLNQTEYGDVNRIQALAVLLVPNQALLGSDPNCAGTHHLEQGRIKFWLNRNQLAKNHILAFVTDLILLNACFIAPEDKEASHLFNQCILCLLSIIPDQDTKTINALLNEYRMTLTSSEFDRIAYTDFLKATDIPNVHKAAFDSRIRKRLVQQCPDKRARAPIIKAYTQCVVQCLEVTYLPYSNEVLAQQIQFIIDKGTTLYRIRHAKGVTKVIRILETDQNMYSILIRRFIRSILLKSKSNPDEISSQADCQAVTQLMSILQIHQGYPGLIRRFQRNLNQFRFAHAQRTQPQQMQSETLSSNH